MADIALHFPGMPHPATLVRSLVIGQFKCIQDVVQRGFTLAIQVAVKASVHLDGCILRLREIVPGQSAQKMVGQVADKFKLGRIAYSDLTCLCQQITYMSCQGLRCLSWVRACVADILEFLRTKLLQHRIGNVQRIKNSG